METPSDRPHLEGDDPARERRRAVLAGAYRIIEALPHASEATEEPSDRDVACALARVYLQILEWASEPPAFEMNDAAAQPAKVVENSVDGASKP